MIIKFKNAYNLPQWIFYQGSDILIILHITHPRNMKLDDCVEITVKLEMFCQIKDISKFCVLEKSNS